MIVSRIVNVAQTTSNPTVFSVLSTLAVCRANTVYTALVVILAVTYEQLIGCVRFPASFTVTLVDVVYNC